MSGKVVLITGASSGLGAAMAESCIRAGHSVALAARRVDRLRELEARLGCPDRVAVIEADVRSLESIRRMVAETEARFGHIDVLVANAGVGGDGPFAESTEEHMLWMMEINVFGVMRCARQVLPGMLRRGSGHILTVASVAGEIPSADLALYSTTKAAVTAFAEAIRRELEPKGIHVSNIIPGFIQSEMTARNDFPMPPASIVGDLVVSLIRSPRRRAVIPRYYGIPIWVNRFAPRLVDIGARVSMAWVMKRQRRP